MKSILLTTLLLGSSVLASEFVSLENYSGRYVGKDQSGASCLVLFYEVSNSNFYGMTTEINGQVEDIKVNIQGHTDRDGKLILQLFRQNYYDSRYLDFRESMPSSYEVFDLDNKETGCYELKKTSTQTY